MSPVVRDTHSRSVFKAVSWRVLGTVATSIIVFAFTQRWAVSLFVGAMEFVSKIGLFWLHERVWDRVTFGRSKPTATVVWFTGLSGSGKSTIAHAVVNALGAKGQDVEQLDGDAVRAMFPATGFTRPERDAHLRRVGFLASRLEQHGITVIASFVSPYRESRDAVRAMCREFVEIYVNTPLEVCESRDVKGLYARARRGELSNFTGIDDPYEAPEQAELVIDTRTTSVEEATKQVLSLLQSRRSGGRTA